MIQTAAMIGMGAIGTVYGHRLFQQYGSRFRVAAGGDREERIRGNGLQLNGGNLLSRRHSRCLRRICPRFINPVR